MQDGAPVGIELVRAGWQNVAGRTSAMCELLERQQRPRPGEARGGGGVALAFVEVDAHGRLPGPLFAQADDQPAWPVGEKPFDFLGVELLGAEQRPVVDRAVVSRWCEAAAVGRCRRLPTVLSSCNRSDSRCSICIAIGGGRAFSLFGRNHASKSPPKPTCRLRKSDADSRARALRGGA